MNYEILNDYRDVSNWPSVLRGHLNKWSCHSISMSILSWQVYLYASPPQSTGVFRRVFSHAPVPASILDASNTLDASSPATASRLTRCLSVGRPCGQFHGWSNTARWSRIIRILRSSSAVPIMIAPRHARIAYMSRSLGRVTSAPGDSARSATSSCTSSTPKSVCLEKGIVRRRRRCVGGDPSTTSTSKPFRLKWLRWSMTTSSSAAVSARGRGRMSLQRIDAGGIRIDVGGNRIDVGGIRTDVSGITIDVGGIRIDVGGICA